LPLLGQTIKLVWRSVVTPFAIVFDGPGSTVFRGALDPIGIFQTLNPSTHSAAFQPFCRRGQMVVGILVK